MQASLFLNTEHHAGPVDPRIFSGFIEHLGRAIYGGIYEPGHPQSDDDGFRTDVLDALRKMRLPLVRYPGGNFVSTYDWRDGIGPRQYRPSRADLAWRSIEPNSFGVDEFMKWSKKLGTSAYMAVNLGTLGPAEAGQLVEYCNFPGGTQWSDRRAANGKPRPYGIKLWSLGNEMDGPWQAGHVPAYEYAMRAQQAAKIMRGLDQSIQLVACGSSGRFMPTYMTWDRTVLEYCWDHVDFLSAHRYSENRRDDTGWFLAEGVEIDRIITDYRSLLGFIRAEKKSNRNVYLCFDEWNGWYRERGGDGQWKTGPHLLEEVYNLEDALVCAQYLNAFIRHADIVKIACIAQLVNVIAPIVTREQGMLLQTSYYPFILFAEHARGISLRTAIRGLEYNAGDRGEVPALDASATFDEENGEAAIFLVNRAQSHDLAVTIQISDQKISAVESVQFVTGPHPKVINTWEKPENVRITNGKAELTGDSTVVLNLPRLGFAAIRLSITQRREESSSRRAAVKMKK